MIVRLKHIDGCVMGFECVAFNVQPDGTGVSFVSPTGKEMDWTGSMMDSIEELTIHYDTGILMQKVVGKKQFHGAQGSGLRTASEVSGRSTAGMGG